ncbi:hypothetical protein [Spirosoma utsteinense]|uniref:hypothetical protein n=1 Tax=Spirosoma utsteinense TaxID=2585773 RepID=UPI00164825BB|nr:hypothetical protein [Spirosoma utsteinense]MBC3788663.1 hypothetical protein [Spirosoma utsteinense]
MKTLISVVALLLLLTNCRSLVGSYVGSVTTIPPGKEFELGNNQHGAFTAQVRNTGAVLVTVSQRQSSGLATPIGQLKPGDQQKLQFSAGTTAVFGNTSAQSAELSLSLTGDTNLRMGYAAK